MAQYREESERLPPADERHRLILQTLSDQRRVDTVELARSLGVTRETVRKDLIQLERHGQLRRVHGGAVPADYVGFEPPVSTRTEFASEKARIAIAALRHLPSSGSVLIDAGSTTEKLAEQFPGDRELTVFTNTLPIALALVGKPLLNVFTLGGRLRGRTLAEVDDWALRSLSEINADVAFLGTNGLSLDRGLTTPDPAEALVKRNMLNSARRRILLCDHSKIGAVSTVQHAKLSDIDLMITDTGTDPALRRSLEQAGLEVEYV